MRKILLMVLLLAGGVTFAQPVLPVDFESTTINYTFTDFDGGTGSVIGNPDVSGINTSANVGQMVKNTGQPWGGSFLTMANPIDFSTNRLFKMKVWSPRVGARVLLKVENASNGGIFFEKEDTSSVANAWEELSFDYNSIDTTQSYQKIVLIWDNGTPGDGSSNFTFYFDDIQLVAGGPALAQIDLPIDFDTPGVDYTVTDFGGNASQLVVDPTDPNNMVIQTEKTAGAQTWAGTTTSTPAGLASAIPFSATETKMTVRVWSPDANIPVRLKVEDANDNTITCETEAMTTVAMAWETLEFDFSNEAPNTAALNIANTYDMASIFFNFGTDGATAGAKTYFWDDVMFGAFVIPLDQIDLPVTFEDTMVDYTLSDFGGNVSMVVVDPTNANNMVAQVEKTAGAQTWAGTTIGTPIGFDNPIPFMMGATQMSVDVWSPDANIPIRLKAEDHMDNTITVETEINNTVASAWETLVFDFNTPAPNTATIDFSQTYDLLSIFFNFGTDGATAGAKTYYFDNVMFGVMISNDPARASLSYYPNPTSDRVLLRSDRPLESVQVYDILGQEIVRLAPTSHEVSVDLSNFDAGMYIFVTVTDGERDTFRVMKQ
ncbi:MAG: T9SS type A sorting domain-containing protein [Bacteroidota bacterium]